MPRGVPKDPAGKKQSEKQQRFALIWTDPGVKGRNAITAYVESGYASLNRQGKPDKTLRVRAYSVLHTPSMQREISRILSLRTAKADARDNLTVDQVRHEHWKLYDLAMRRGMGEDGADGEASSSDLSVATQNLIALGKTVAAYVDRTELDVGRQREYSELERAEALLLAKLRLEAGGVGVLTEAIEHPVVLGEGDGASPSPESVRVDEDGGAAGTPDAVETGSLASQGGLEATEGLADASEAGAVPAEEDKSDAGVPVP